MSKTLTKFINLFQNVPHQQFIELSSADINWKFKKNVVFLKECLYKNRPNQTVANKYKFKHIADPNQYWLQYKP